MRKKAVFKVLYSYQYEGDEVPSLDEEPWTSRTVAASDAMAAGREVIEFEMKQTAATYDPDGEEVSDGPQRKCVAVIVHSIEKKEVIDATAR